jgi:hypothetical protein
MKKLLVLMGVLAIAAPAFADLMTATPERIAGYTPGAGSPATTGTIVYDNVVTVVSAYSRTNPPAEEIGDDLLMTSGGELDSVAFSVFNSGTSAGPLVTADLTVRFYDWDSGTGTYVYNNGLYWDNFSFGTGLALGYYTTLSVTNISSFFDIFLTNDILATLTISDLTGGANKVGQVITAQAEVGSTDDVFYRDGGWYWFNGNPYAGFYWEVDVIPEPASLVLVLVGLTLLRRR